VSTQLCNQGCWLREDELGVAFTGFDALAASELPAAGDALRALTAVADAARRAGSFDDGAAVASGRTVRGTVAEMPVLGAAPRTGLSVAAGGAFGAVAAAVPVVLSL
jgi:hypothetical protein